MGNQNFNVEALRAITEVFPGGRNMFCEFTGISIAVLRNYIYSKTVPDEEQTGKMARALGVPESVFDVNRNTMGLEEIKRRVASKIRQNYEKYEEKKGIKNREIDVVGKNIAWKDSEVPYPYNLIDAIFREHVDVIISKDVEDGIEYAVSTLNDREQKVIKHRFQEYMSHKEIGKEFDVTHERIRQIESKALRKLRHPTRTRYFRFGLTGLERYSSLEELQKAIDEKKKELDNLNYEIELATKQIEKTQRTIPKSRNCRILGEWEDIEELDFSVRTFNCLRRQNIRTVGQLIDVARKEENLLQIRNMGIKSIQEIYGRLWERCRIDPRKDSDG